MDVIDWLLGGDPAIRWQAGRDLLSWPRGLVQEQRSRVAREGWGKRLLELQDEGGTWAGKLYSPKWTSTTYTLLLLRRLGLCPHPDAGRAVELLLGKGLRADGGIDLTVTGHASEACVTGMILALTSTFLRGDDRITAMVDYLVDRQLDDGAWNCVATAPTDHGSMHTTISVLEGLSACGRVPAVRDQAHQFLFRHHLYRSHRTGEIINPAFTRFSFPPRWHFDVLRGLDYLAESGVERDERLTDGIDLVRKKRRPDGTWLLQNTHPGQTYFELETAGEPSRWNTLRAMRVLQWWEST
jgi:hypothetical protein